ncbi:MAG: XRE family transcriptional regulator [Gaiellaceae bacterium]|nr:MAG: XRE family transcriptional regulator [Gaiellaceae bacterium]
MQREGPDPIVDPNVDGRTDPKRLHFARVFDIGSSLRDARLRQGLDFPELEERTKIRPKYLRALEDERFDILPAPTYVRGFLRSYAEALGLEGQPFVDEYNSRFAVGEDETLIRTRRTPTRATRREPRQSRLAVLVVLAIAVVTALVIAAWRFGGPEDESVPGLATPSQPTAPVAAGMRGVARLTVSARAGASWMEVRAGLADGRLLYSGTLERGQTIVFQGKRLRLALAEPENVVVRLNGSRVDLPAGTTFSVTPTRIVRSSP